MEELKINNFPEKQMIEIEGIEYSYALFRGLGSFIKLDQLFKIVKRKNGVITIERIEKKE